MRCLAIVMAYNEADCIGGAVQRLLDADHQVHVINHGSTDATRDIVLGFAPAYIAPHRPRKHRAVRLVDVNRKSVGYFQLFRWISAYVRRQRQWFDWVTWLAADEVLLPPGREPMLRDHLEAEWSKGVEVIRPWLLEFWPSTADVAEEEEPDPLKRFRHFKSRPAPNCPRSWAIALTRTMPHGLHRRNNQWEAKVSHNKWWLDHYPVRSIAHGRRKIMKERPWVPQHYRRYRVKKCKNLVRDAEQLECLDSFSFGG